MLRTLEERDIRFVRLWFTDVLGTLKSVSVAPAELESAFDEGIGFDGSAIEGFARVFESDMVAMPDPTTFQVFPFEGGASGESARMFCDILLPDGTPSWADPRHVLRRALSKAAEKGFTFYTHPEIEFFLVEDAPADGRLPVPVDAGGYFEHTTHSAARDFRRQAVLALERIGISVEYSHHEVAPGQQEIDLRYADALTTADNIMTFRHVVKEVALSHGVQATFMPKPFSDQPGSGMHTHLSLFEGEHNAFHDAGDPMKLSKVGRAFIAGLLTHAREYTAVTNQWVNSYKRLFPQPLPDRITESPAYVCWGHLNRSALVRVPAYGEVPGGQPDGPLEPGTPFLVPDAVRVLDGGPVARVEREAPIAVVEEQPDLLEPVHVGGVGPHDQLTGPVGPLVHLGRAAGRVAGQGLQLGGGQLHGRLGPAKLDQGDHSMEPVGRLMRLGLQHLG